MIFHRSFDCLDVHTPGTSSSVGRVAAYEPFGQAFDTRSLPLIQLRFTDKVLPIYESVVKDISTSIRISESFFMHFEWVAGLQTDIGCRQSTRSSHRRRRSVCAMC